MALQLEQLAIHDDTFRHVTVVHFTGSNVSLDEEASQSVHDQLLALADEPSDGQMLLDFGNVEFISGATLGTLLRLRKMLLAKGRQLAVGNLSPNICGVFAVARLDSFFDPRPAGQDGKKEFEGESGLASGILAVDDEPAILRMLAATLRSEGFNVWLAGHGQQAIQLFLRHLKGIAVVLLDVLMPGMDGPQILTTLQKFRPTVRCCFMTGNPAPYTEQSLLQMGALRIFHKPFAFTEVSDGLTQVIRRTPDCESFGGSGSWN
jgi:anti-anti-sigma factor